MEYSVLGKYLVSYGLPILALIISLLSFRDAKKANKIRNRVQEIEEKLIKYELEDKELERAIAQEACVEGRVMRISKGKYKMKIWNSGKGVAYNVNFMIPPEYEGMVWKDKVPYEFLDPGKSFEENVLVYSGTPEKFKITTFWDDKQGNPNSKEQIVSI